MIWPTFCAKIGFPQIPLRFFTWLEVVLVVQNLLKTKLRNLSKVFWYLGHNFGVCTWFSRNFPQWKYWKWVIIKILTLNDNSRPNCNHCERISLTNIIHLTTKEEDPFCKMRMTDICQNLHHFCAKAVETFETKIHYTKVTDKLLLSYWNCF